MEAYLKQGTNRKFGYRLGQFALVILTCMLTVLLIPISAFGATSTIDNSQPGKITLEVYGVDGTTGLNGVVYSYMKIADVDQATLPDGSNSLVYTNVDASFLTAVGSPGVDAGSPAAYKTTTLQAALAAHSATIASAPLSMTAMPATAGGAAEVAASVTVEGLATGLYLVIQKSAPSEVPIESYTEPFLVSLPTGSATGWDYNVLSKTKNITNDESITHTVDHESISIGGTVNFTATATAAVTSSLLKYSAYSIVDALGAGFTLPLASQVTVTGSIISFIKDTDYKVTLNALLSPPNSIKVEFTTEGLAKINNIKAQETITVTFPSTLSSTSVIGSIGNSSTATLNYTHAVVPGVPKIAAVNVYSYGATLKKISSVPTSLALPGATFKIYASESDAKTEKNALPFYTGLVGTLVGGSTVTQVTTDVLGLASFFGLAAGDYYLVETHAPDGYTLLSRPIKVTISAATTGLTPAITVANTPQAGSPGGITLPITGGGGIGLLVLGGVLLMVVSGSTYYMVSKRRKKSNR